MFKCLECGRKFKTTRAAERAADKGCPGCGGVDVDLDMDLPPDPEPGTRTAGYLIGPGGKAVCPGVVCRCGEPGAHCPAHGTPPSSAVYDDQGSYD